MPNYKFANHMDISFLDEGKHLWLRDYAFSDANQKGAQDVTDILDLLRVAQASIKDNKYDVTDRSNIKGSAIPDLDFVFKSSDEAQVVALALINHGEKEGYFTKPEAKTAKEALGLRTTPPCFINDFNIPRLDANKDTLIALGFLEDDITELRKIKDAAQLETALVDIAYFIQYGEKHHVPNVRMTKNHPVILGYLGAARDWEKKNIPPAKPRTFMEDNISAVNLDPYGLSALGLHIKDYDKLKEAKSLDELRDIKVGLEKGEYSGTANIAVERDNTVFRAYFEDARNFGKAAKKTVSASIAAVS